MISCQGCTSSAGLWEPPHSQRLRVTPHLQMHCTLKRSVTPAFSPIVHVLVVANLFQTDPHSHSQCLLSVVTLMFYFLQPYSRKIKGYHESVCLQISLTSVQNYVSLCWCHVYNKNFKLNYWHIPQKNVDCRVIFFLAGTLRIAANF